MIDKPSVASALRNFKLSQRTQCVVHGATSLAFILIALMGTMPSFADEVAQKDGVLFHEKKVITVSEKGISPSEIVLDHHDGSVFFLNATKEEPISFSMEWGKREAHCASQNLRLTDQGILTTVSPIEPGDFEISCFPKAGDYPFQIQRGGAVDSGVIHVLPPKHS